MSELDDMTDGYIECALWAGLDWTAVDDETIHNPEPLDETYSVDDIAPEAIEEARRLCREFLAANRKDLGSYHDGNPAQWGHDLHLTQNGHGAGFWVRYYGPDNDKVEAGRRLTDAAKAEGEASLTPGDDGRLYWE